MEQKKVTIRRLQEMKTGGEFIVSLGVYDSPMAVAADPLGFEIFVIGNSGPMSLFGHRRSTQVPAEELLFMTQAVTRVTRHSLVVATMPYASYQASHRDAVQNAARLVSDGGADGVQCHGNRHTAKYIASIVQAGIPVLAHLGLQSPFKAQQGGFRVQGQSAAEAKKIIGDADALADAGVFAFTLELVPSELTALLKERMPAPVLSLGSGPLADGVYLVSADAVGFSALPSPKNAGRFAEVLPLMEDGLRTFRDEVRAGIYPGEGELRQMAPGEHERFLKMMGTQGQ
jgi:3-methyl-2-oxobutanoate hydroxymethyltransferase